jgi:hypothetical protein
MPYRFLKEIFFIKGKFLDITVRYEYLKFIQAGALGEVASRIEANVKILTFVSIQGLRLMNLQNFKIRQQKKKL